jgi:hypothetical protein
MFKSSSIYRNFFAWLLLSLYVLNCFKVVQPYINYKVNFEYISTVLCENKEKPELHCDGQCYLNKELKKAAEEEAQKNAVAQKVIEVESIPANNIEISFDSEFISINKIIYPSFKEGFSSVIIEYLTPPPRA